MHDKRIIRFGFCDIQNNQGFGPDLRLIKLTSTLIIPAITKTSSDNSLLQAEKGSDLNRFYGRSNRLDYLLLTLSSKYRTFCRWGWTTLLCVECCLFEFITFLRLVFSWGFRLPQLYWVELSSYVTVLQFLSSEDIIPTTITIITVIMSDIITTIVEKWPFLPLCLSWALLHSVLESGQRFAPVWWSHAVAADSRR